MGLMLICYVTMTHKVSGEAWPGELFLSLAVEVGKGNSSISCSLLFLSKIYCIASEESLEIMPRRVDWSESHTILSFVLPDVRDTLNDLR